MTPQLPFTDVPTAIEEVRAGRMIVVIDDEDRENEGDLTLAAEKATPEAINFMAKYGRGLVCLAMTEERLDHLRIGNMTSENTSQYGTAFCEAIDARQGVTTGISAHDRAHTIKVAIDPATRPSDLARPGHMFPLRARKGGVLVRAGQTEASVDLARLAGMVPAGIICEIMKDDGTMARVPDLIEFCRIHEMKMLTVAELIRYRMQHERYVHRVGEAHDRYQLRRIPSDCLRKRSGWRRVAHGADSRRHRAIRRSRCWFACTRIACWAMCSEPPDATAIRRWKASLKIIAEEDRGALIYLHQTSKGFSAEKVGEQSLLTFHRESRHAARSQKTSVRFIAKSGSERRFSRI